MKKITTEIELRPWTTPNFATQVVPPKKREEGFKEAPSIHVCDLDQDALDALAEKWLDDLYKKAGKKRPPTYDCPPQPTNTEES